jgi:hypothetical protein
VVTGSLLFGFLEPLTMSTCFILEVAASLWVESVQLVEALRRGIRESFTMPGEGGGVPQRCFPVQHGTGEGRERVATRLLSPSMLFDQLDRVLGGPVDEADVLVRVGGLPGVTSRGGIDPN